MYAIFRGTVVCPKSIISSYSIFNVQKAQKKQIQVQGIVGPHFIP